MSITELTDEHLKALGFDVLTRLETEQRNLAIIRQELDRRQQEAQKPAAPESQESAP